jgi:hypothetical protein
MDVVLKSFLKLFSLRIFGEKFIARVNFDTSLREGTILPEKIPQHFQYGISLRLDIFFK